MNWLRCGPSSRRWLLNVALIVVAGADAVGSLFADDEHPMTPVRVAISGVAVLAVCVRERWPFAAFLLTVPGLFVTDVVIASLIALFTVVHRYAMDWRVVCCIVAMFVGYTSPWEVEYQGLPTVINAAYAVVFTAAPVWLALLVRARTSLSDRIVQIEEARKHEQELLVERALASERAALAREMHDVVSHQVSLIAVQAGALQVTASDRASADVAMTIRTLAVRTLDELREMVGVLRPSGDGELALSPQPGFSDIPELVAGCGIPAEVRYVGEPGVEPSPAVQRAIYRAIQEGLTNVAKHSPGSSAIVDLRIDADRAQMTLTNTAPTRPVDPLPSAKHGLLGLRERAELLGGSLHGEHRAEGGYRLSMTLPTHVTSHPFGVRSAPRSQ